MKRVQYIFLLVLCFVLICSACGKKDETNSSPFLDSIQVTIKEKKLINKSHIHVYQVILVNEKGKEVEVGSVNFKTEMKSMNHHVEAKMKKISIGVYEVSIELPMEGTWSKQIKLIEGENERIISSK